jgi:hypothetical protein
VVTVSLEKTLANTSIALTAGNWYFQRMLTPEAEVRPADWDRTVFIWMHPADEPALL